MGGLVRLLVLFFLALTVFSSLVAFKPDDSKAVSGAVHACVTAPSAGGHAFSGTCRNSEH
jgi:hypothetical protein